MPGAAAPDPSAPVRCRAMDLRRLRAGEWLAAVSGVVLLVSLFLPWYEVASAPGGFVRYGPLSRAATASGWESLSAIDVVLALIAACAVLVAVVTATHAVPAVPVALSALVSLVGLVGLILVLLRLLDLPDWAGGREWGIWLALASTVGIIAGTMLAMREEIRPGRTRVEIEAIPAPRP
jgi:hypothetical protein